ncbi:3-oxoacid CoA-transferase subunit A [Bacillus pinisoli]|uniref:3-oxoacid CoA-transferase subunit A n=1 Tax=Bacillus pinisoli TaxID=2901866 RepID=UPI001FF20ABA|nr:CoA transferase subunit A [Bacillus pinisoli]
MTNKQLTLDEVLDHIVDGSTIMFGGFGGIGTPPTIVSKMVEKGVKDLTLIGNDTGFPTIGIGPLIVNKQVKKIITSHIGSNPVAGKLMTEGELEVEFCPQGTLVERMRAGGVGLGGILVDVGVGTIVENNKQIIELDGNKYLIESALRADISIVFAKKGDYYGNLLYDKSARNTNPLVAMAGAVTFAEVEELVPVGSLSPEEIITPGCFIHGIIKSEGVNWKWAWE